MFGKLSIGSVVVVGFFLILFYGLFLGDGYQTLIEPYIGGTIIVIFLTNWLYNKQVRVLDRPLQTAWVAVLLVYFLLTFTSRSIGYSITETIRILIGYLVFMLFYSLGTSRVRTLFFRTSIFFVCFAACISVMLLLFPNLGQKLPPINLLFAYYGHNHLASLLLFVLPGVAELFVHKKNWQRLMLCLFILLNIFLTFSRGAYLITGLYFLIRFWNHAWSKSTRTRVISVIVSAAFGIAIYWLMTNEVKLPGLPIHLQMQLSKASPLEHRISYWDQTLKSFASHPLFGSGPGTFYLESLKFQSKPNTFSYYAHSYPLQILSELGILGFVTLICLYGLLGKHLFTSLKPSKTRLEVKSMIWGTGVVFVYSFIDFNLNFLVVWVFFWASIGIIYESPYKIPSTNIRQKLLWVTVCVIGISFLSTFLSLVQGEDKERTFFISPYSSDRALDVLEQSYVGDQIISDSTLKAIQFFHGEEPDVLRKMIEHYKREGDVENTRKVFSKLLTTDPKNISNHKMYLFWAAEKLDDEEIKKAFIESAGEFLLARFKSQINEMSAMNSNVFALYLGTHTERLKNEPAELYHMKLLYLMGLSVIDDDPRATRTFWTFARDIYPLTGLLYHELTALSLTHFSDTNAAAVYIQECMNVPHAALHCEQIQKDFGNLPPPGFVKEDILNLNN